MLQRSDIGNQLHLCVKGCKIIILLPESQSLREAKGKRESEIKREKKEERERERDRDRERERETERGRGRDRDRESDREREITFLHRIVRITASLIQCLDESTQHCVYVNRAQLRCHTCITPSTSSQQHINSS